MIHAAGESSPGQLPPETRAIALHVPGEEALLSFEQQLQKSGFGFTSIREPDMPWNGQLMAIGLKPTPRTKELRRLMARLPLAGGTK